MIDTIFKPSNCDIFHHICSYGFTGKENPPAKHNNIALFFTGIIYNFQEIVERCMDDILKKKQNLLDTRIHKDSTSDRQLENNITMNFNDDCGDFNAALHSSALRNGLKSRLVSRDIEDVSGTNEELSGKSLHDDEDDYRFSYDIDSSFTYDIDSSEHEITKHIEPSSGNSTQCAQSSEGTNENLFKYQYELIIYLYNNYGMDYTLQLLDGEFAFILIDDNLQENHTSLYVVRDRMGIQPMYILSEKSRKSQPISNNRTVRERPFHKVNETKIYGFATDLSLLSDNINSTDGQFTIVSFPPGTYSKYTKSIKVLSSWRLNREQVKYYTPIPTCFILEKSRFLIKTQLNNIIQNLQSKLIDSIKKKWNLCKHQNNRIICLLSGGVDSSIIAALTSEILRKHNLFYKDAHRHEQDGVLETFCIGFKNSDDIRYARIVADKIGSIHHEVIITEKEYMDTIPIVIQILETYDTATVRAGVAQYLLCKHISKTTNCKNILTGDGADELMGGYMYMNASPNMIEFDRETKSLMQNYYHNYGRLRNIYKFFGLVNHSPFLEQQFINYYLSIPLEFRYPHWYHNHFKNFQDYFTNFNINEKYLLRLSFSKDYYVKYDYSTIFPEEIIWRPKEDFFDGISSYPYSTRNMILRQLQWYVSNNPQKNENFTREQQYYYDIFEHFYEIKITIHEWRLKYIVPTNEPSAHALDFYFDYNPEYKDRSL
jgi:asparagine synthase (glutamine-hydrolysing)